MLDIVAAVFSIIVIDLVLSGDNAVVIGMAARRLSPENRRRAIVWGGAGAVGLRVFFTAIATLLLDIPYLLAIGGFLLLWIAYKLLKPHDPDAHVSEANSLGEAIRTIVLADVVMSLDNILAVAGASHGGSDDSLARIGLLLFGLALSIPILLLGSELVARLLGRYAALVYVGAIILVWTAVGMILEDDLVHEWREFAWWETLLITGVVGAGIVLLGVRTQRGASPPEVSPAEGIEDPATPDVAADPVAEHAQRAERLAEPVAAGHRPGNGREPAIERSEAHPSAS